MAPLTITSLSLREVEDGMSSLTSLSAAAILFTRNDAVFLNEIFDQYPGDWSSLRSLTLRLPGKQVEGAKEALDLLEVVPRIPSLTNITLEWELYEIKGLRHDLSHNGIGTWNETYKNLEHALLAFSESRIICILSRPLSTNNGSFWLSELGRHLPVLHERGGVALQSRCKDNREFWSVFPPRNKLIIYHEAPPIGHDEGVWALAISPDSKWVASGSDDSTIILWDADYGSIAQQWIAHGYKRVRTLAFSPDGRYLVSGGYDNNAAIWDLGRSPKARKVATLEGHAKAVWTCAWSPDGRTIATGSSDGTARLWDAHTFQQRALHYLKGEINRLAFSPNACWLVCVSHRRECAILNVTSGTLYKSLWSYPSGSGDIGTPRPVLPYAVVSAAFHPRSMHLALTSYGRGPRINVVDIETGSTILPDGGEGEEFAGDISFSPDGKLVLGVGGNRCYIWNALTGDEVLRLEGHKENVTSAVFSPCGKYIASASSDETVRLWKTSDGSCLATLLEHRESVEHVAFSPDGKTLSSGGRDGRVTIRHMLDIIPRT